jgi:hypothetical protein
MVQKAGDVVGIHLRPHDLRRHAAIFASRSGVPIEMITQVIKRCNMKTSSPHSDASARSAIQRP